MPSSPPPPPLPPPPPPPLNSLFAALVLDRERDDGGVDAVAPLPLRSHTMHVYAVSSVHVAT